MKSEQLQIDTDCLYESAEQIDALISSLKQKLKQLNEEFMEVSCLWEEREKVNKKFENNREQVEAVLEFFQFIQKYELYAKKEYEFCGEKVLDMVSDI